MLSLGNKMQLKNPWSNFEDYSIIYGLWKTGQTSPWWFQVFGGLTWSDHYWHYTRSQLHGLSGLEKSRNERTSFKFSFQEYLTGRVVRLCHLETCSKVFIITDIYHINWSALYGFQSVSPLVKNYDIFSRVFEIANQQLTCHSLYLAPGMNAGNLKPKLSRLRLVCKTLK